MVSAPLIVRRFRGRRRATRSAGARFFVASLFSSRASIGASGSSPRAVPLARAAHGGSTLYTRSGRQAGREHRDAMPQRGEECCRCRFSSRLRLHLHFLATTSAAEHLRQLFGTSQRRLSSVWRNRGTSQTRRHSAVRGDAPTPREAMPRKGRKGKQDLLDWSSGCLLYTSPSPRDMRRSRMPSSA